jgi:predicted transcriptional regulator
MLVTKSILQTDFSPLQGTDTVAEVKDRMDELAISVLPVVDQTTQKLIGQVAYSQLELADGETLVSDLKLDEAIKVYKGQHIFEAARLILQYELEYLPLVDKEWKFLGGIDRQRVFYCITRMLNVQEEGSVLTIELNPIDFSISELVQIVETEGAKILGMTVEIPDSTRNTFEVSLKLNMKDLSRVTAALKRYDYQVLVESESTIFGKDLEDRADELLKYIDM